MDEHIKKVTGKIYAYARVTYIPVLLAILFALQNLAFNEWLGIYAKAYTVRLLLVSFALGIVFFGPALLFKKKYKYLYLLSISFLVSFILSAQFLYYKYSQSFLQFSAVKYFKQIGSIDGTIQTLLTPNLLLFFCNFFIVLLLFFLASKRKYIEFKVPRWEKAVIILLLMVIVFFGYKYLLDTEKKEWGSTNRLYTDVYDLKALVGKMGIMNFFLEDTFKYMLRSNLVSDDDRIFLKNLAGSRNNYSLKGNYFGLNKDKNIIIIQVESLENVVINKKINGQEITPNLNRLAENGIYFDNYYAQAGPGNTADAEFSTMNSLYPLADDVVFINYAKNTYNALPQLLIKNGYKTYSLHGDVPTFWNRSNIYPQLGYQKTFGLDDFIITRSVGKGPSDLGDEDLFVQSLEKLKSLPQPFMATITTMSSHTPFILPADLQTLNISEDSSLNKTQKNYLQSIHYTDKAIGEFVEKLKEDNLYNNSLIFIWGDHGSYTGITPALNQSNILPELNNSQVPLIILNSKIDSQTISAPGSHLDIYPTIINLLGIVPPRTLLGQDLFNNINPTETHFEVVSGGIDAILTKNLAYQASVDGIFIHGSCQSIPHQKTVSISDCQAIYTEQANNLKASNIIIRGDLLDFYSLNLK